MECDRETSGVKKKWQQEGWRGEGGDVSNKLAPRLRIALPHIHFPVPQLLSHLAPILILLKNEKTHL